MRLYSGWNLEIPERSRVEVEVCIRQSRLNLERDLAVYRTRDLIIEFKRKKEVIDAQEWLHTMTNQQITSQENYNAGIINLTMKLELFLLVDEVGLTKVLKD